MASAQNLKATMLNVRKAYRFLGDFTNRLQGIIQVLQDEFPGLSYCWWEPVHHWKMSAKGNPALRRRWSWDSLPLYNFRVLYLPEGENQARPKSWMLEICVELDDGFEAAGDWPDPQKFGNVADALSGIHLVAWRCDELAKELRGTPPAWWKIWGNLDDWNSDWEDLDKVQIQAIGGSKFSLLPVYEQLEALGDREKVQGFARKAKDLFKKQLALEIREPGTEAS